MDWPFEACSLNLLLGDVPHHEVLCQAERAVIGLSNVIIGGGKGAKSKYALISDIPKITFHISLSSLVNTPNKEENSHDFSELQSKSLAISQSSSYSESNSPKLLDNSDISSLAKENIEEENKEGADPWD